MLKLTLSFALYFILSAQVFAGSLLFKKTGVVDRFLWAPPQYTTGFKYDIFYYIPASLDLTQKNKAIIFMHGGGSSTMTREGSANVVISYLQNIVKLAETQKAILVMPSGSGLNWGGHTRGLIREVAKLIRYELKTDPDKMTLAGHSMGGMGITRNSFFLADQFNVIMPIAAGIDPVYLVEDNLITRFNVPYHHVQGLKDHFDVFVTRTQDEVKFMKALEAKMGRPSYYKATFTEDAHNYNLAVLNQLMSGYFQKKRNLYQPKLYGSFYYNNTIVTDNNIRYNVLPTAEYFWLEVIQFLPSTTGVRTFFETDIKSNVIEIKIKTPAHNISTLRVYVSRKMVDLAKPVTIKVNGVKKFAGVIALNTNNIAQTIVKKKDFGFLFDNYVDIKL